MAHERDDLADVMPCPDCGRGLPTRVLADAVTLIAVGCCPEHGTRELSRVSLGATAAAASEDDVYPMSGAVSDQVLTRVSYRPGPHCGRRLGRDGACGLEAGHEGPHERVQRR